MESHFNVKYATKLDIQNRDNFQRIKMLEDVFNCTDKGEYYNFRLIRKPASLKSMYEMNSLVVFLGDFP
jgi:hypothetical protein